MLWTRGFGLAIADKIARSCNSDATQVNEPLSVFPVVDAPATQARRPEIAAGGASIVRSRSVRHLKRRGIFVVNPPYAFTQALPPKLEPLRAVPAPDGRRGEIATDLLGD
jgi:hypothetical protein